MGVQFTARDIAELVTPQIALEAARDAVRAEAEGEVFMPPRIDMPTPGGFLRVMPGRFRDIGGVKTMSMVRGVGNRYLLVVQALDTGAVLAIFDANEITRLRTAATTAVAAEMLLEGRMPNSLGVIGTGFEAIGHLRLLANQYRFDEVRVFSRSAQRRNDFATQMSAELKVNVVPAESPEEAVEGLPLVCLATKDTSPVVNGTAFAAGAVVLSIGSTRPNLRELDDRAFARSAGVLVDSVAGVLAESGDVQRALAVAAIAKADLVSMAQWSAISAPRGEITVFKSVGTSAQDLALAAAVIEAANNNGGGTEFATELAALKADGSALARDV